ncbi:MAG TPA: prenyltransferase/squalene oxidase repeat-containing protein [Pirellulales bacterium]|nr:prenyltransferase/squalene oxidase repeat-containing protein [Pirellulales bacterium]
MSTAEQDSSLEIVLPVAAGAAAPGDCGSSSALEADAPANLTATNDGDSSAGLWLNGDVLSCACPECHAPMSIRLWLLMADCWMCGTSIELTEEQERAARKLLAARDTATPKTSPPQAPAPAKPAAPPERWPTTPPVAAKSAAAPSPAWAATAPAGPVTKAALARDAARDWFRDLPAWLVSLILHIVAILLLGLLTIAHEDRQQRQIMLAATMGTLGTDGGEEKPDEDEDAVVVKDPGPEEAAEPMPTLEETPPAPEPPPPPEPEPQPESLPPRSPRRELLPTIEEQTARELPTYESVREALAAPELQRMFEGRDPRVRTQMVLAEGGTMYTEAAVAQGLYWLHRHQARDGHWSLDRFNRHGNCNGRCGGEGDGESDVGATALALLPFLGAGQTHTRGIYKETVERGLMWLLEEQESNGDLRGDGQGRMYAHGIASIVLCEAYALSGDETLRAPAQRAIDFIVRAQHKSSGRNSGGWRYEPRQAGDTSVVGWQLMALRSGRMGGLHVPSGTFTQAGKFLDHVQHGRYGGLYSYQRGRTPDAAMIAEGLLCRQYLGWPARHRGLHEGVNHLLAEHLPSKDDPNIYYWYYGTQVMHHLGGEAWERWNNATREALVEMQERDGHEAGSWSPEGGAIGGHDVRVGGRIYMTALAICTLEVYYRHLPIYRAITIAAD